MNTSSLLASASLVALVGVAAGCDSSGPGTTSTEAMCARLSACGLSFDPSAGESFGGCQYFSEYAGYLGDGGASLAKLATAYRNCLTAASTCDELRACSTPTAAQSAVCDTTAQDTCSGNTLVNCSMMGSSRGVTAFDCAAAGLICGASADGAMCGMASCDPASTPPICNGDLLIYCELQDHVLVAHSCASEGAVCANSAGGSTCMGKTACDSLTFQSRCEGTMRVECINDTVFRFDCSLLRSGLTCGLDATGYPDCKPMAAECDMGASESCQDGVISYCSVGLPATFDCRSVGLSGCATQVIGTNTVARCVL